MSYNHANDGFSSSVHSLNEIFQCFWTVEYGLHCNDLICGRDVSTHLRERHGIKGADDLLVRCYWEACGVVLKKESLSRHVQATHLRILYPCDTCSQMFTRTYNRDVHKRTCPTPQQ